MLNIEKLSKKNMGDVIGVLFPSESTLIPQKRLNAIDRVFVVDYFLEIGNDKLVFEFDGPTHFTDSKTQLRDLYLQAHCITNGYILVRVPYFIQIEMGTLSGLFPGDIIARYDLYSTIEGLRCEYKSGFHDPKIVYPGNFNHRGWDIFWELYVDLFASDGTPVMREIHHSLTDINLNISMGIGWHDHKDKRIFVEECPT